MFAFIVSFFIAGAPVSHAGSAPSQKDQAEFVRLTEEVEKLAHRNAWAGVERTFLQLLETGITPSFDAWVSGAHASRAIGDVGACRTRLSAANELTEDREIVDWLWTIDAEYGKVFLACDQGKNPASLDITTMPFNPDHQRAVEFAKAQVAEGCYLDGYLPQGVYTFKTESIEDEIKVIPRIQTVRMDLRTHGNSKPPKKSKKKHKK
jgi:hypothetical protein